MFNKIYNNVIYKLLYPILFYLIAYNAFYALFSVLGLTGKIGPLVCNGLSALLTIPIMIYFYNRADIVRPDNLFEKESLLRDIGFVALILFCGLSLNVLASHLPVYEWFPRYESVMSAQNNGNYFAKLFANVFAIPVLEEIVFRGILCGQLQKWYNNFVAIFISAFCFGAFHFNAVQFVYGFVMGLIIGFCYIKSNRLWITIAGHMILNFTVATYITFFAVK